MSKLPSGRAALARVAASRPDYEKRITVLMRWWGWGAGNKDYSLDHKSEFLDYLEQHIGLSSPEAAPAVSVEDIKLKDPRFPAHVRQSMVGLVGTSAVSEDKTVRVMHSLGKSYSDLIAARKGQINNPPDLVVYPQDEKQINEIIRLASDAAIAIVPFGGGTSVVGGVEPKIPSHFGAAVSLDLSRMSKLVDMDECACIATLQPGLTGPQLEEKLRTHGMTLGHFPQSFEFSTLGGWLATRSAGQASTKYGKIEDLVVSLNLLTPNGSITTSTVPASATGPNINQMIIGSEGIFGVISEAKMAIHKLPESYRYRGVLFKNLNDGLDTIRHLLREGVIPAVVRLSDPQETRTSIALSGHDGSFFKTLKQDLGLKFLQRKGYADGCLMILGFEGPQRETTRALQSALRMCKLNGGFDLGSEPGEKWNRERFELPYLRDALLDRGIMIDTLETATVWSNLAPLRTRILDAITAAIAAFGVKALVMAHISHAYQTGASLYFTFLAKQVRGAEFDQWQLIKRAALDCIVEHGGTISHHHGVGSDHAAWLPREHGPLTMKALHALKNTLDPKGIMNPNKLIISHAKCSY